jgi:protein-S-isoprenylcysteine O-methyltransferase Ste14
MLQTALALLITLTVPLHAGAQVLSSVRTARLEEPGSLILLGAGLIAVALWLSWSRRRQGRRSSPVDERR